MSFIFALVVSATLAGAEPAPGHLTLNIVDQSGQVLPAVEVAVAGAVTRQATSDNEGTAVFRDLPAGSYRLSTRISGFVSESRAVAIRAGVNTTVRIEFRLEWSTDPRSGKPVRNTIVLHCGSPASPIESVWDAADAVAWVRIAGQTVYDHWKLQDDGFPIVTVHDVRIVELFKPHARLTPGTTVMSILQEGGTIERTDLIENASASGSKLLDDHREYVVFLRWSDRWQRWGVEACDLGALEIVTDSASRADRGGTSPPPEDGSAKELLTVLRRMKE
jgi:hypothetical protein